MLLLDIAAFLDPNEIEKCMLIRKQWKIALHDYYRYVDNIRRFTKLVVRRKLPENWGPHWQVFGFEKKKF
jgi:hypothetical protein